MVISTFYELAGTMHGMVLIQERGLCTDEQATVSGLQSKECGRMELVPLPRQVGIVAKSLDGQTIQTDTVITPFGAFREVVQLGKTQFRQFAPTQPMGIFQGKRIMTYERSWLQLDANAT